MNQKRCSINHVGNFYVKLIMNIYQPAFYDFLINEFVVNGKEVTYLSVLPVQIAFSKS